MKRFKHTLEEYPALIKDWDYEKNDRLPSEVGSQSNTYANWKCHKCGYSWEAKICNRVNGRGCPCCAHKVLVKGINDLETLHPDLAKEWHPTKNGDLKPCDVLPGQRLKVWWLCPNGHSYQATLNHRSNPQGTGCPICNSGRQTSFREQALFYYVSKLYPDTISRFKADFLDRFELDIYIPSVHTAIEYDGEAWHKESKFEREKHKYQICKVNHIRLIRVKEKIPDDFSRCYADLTISGDNFDDYKEVEKVIHSVLESIYYKGCYWLNPMDIDLVRDRFIIAKYATSIKNSFAEEYPNIAKEWHPTKNGDLKPNMFKSGSDFKVWWLCPVCKYEWEASISHRTGHNCTGCPKCSLKKQKETRIKNILNSGGCITNQKLIEEWHPTKNGNLTLQDVTRGSSKKVWWLCSKCGYEWEAKISNREHGRGCPKCAGRKLFPGENDLATIHPELLKEQDFAKNLDVNPHFIHHGSTEKVFWICSKCGNEYIAPIARRDKGSGCKKCADKVNAAKARSKIKSKAAQVTTLSAFTYMLLLFICSRV